MQIFSINNSFNKYNHSNCKTFTAHPDFYKFNSMQSCFFRRGEIALPNNEGYKDIENLFCTLFEKAFNKPKKMLVIGLAHSQEIFSYLASIKGIIGKRPIHKAVDLYTVDLQSKPEFKQLRLDSFPDLLDYQKFPKYAGKSFIEDEKFIKKESYKTDEELTVPIQYLLYSINSDIKPLTPQKPDFRINDEILYFVNKTYNNPQKSKWESRVQEVITEYPEENFDIISANNVFGYISDSDYLSTLSHIKRTLSKQGVFISDPYVSPSWVQKSEVLSSLKQLNSGIYQKI